jgi:hypothetical protein
VLPVESLLTSKVGESLVEEGNLVFDGCMTRTELGTGCTPILGVGASIY